MTPTTTPTMQELIEKYRGMEARERDALCAERVMGWRWVTEKYHLSRTEREVPKGHPGGRWGGSKGPGWYWHPSSDPAADYSVLKHVRETWDVERLMSFCLVARTIRDARPRIPKLFIFNNGDQMLYYECGDHALAALVAYDLSTPLPEQPR